MASAIQKTVGENEMKYPQRNFRVATRTIDGEAVVVCSDDATLHSLNEVGTIIWEMSDGHTSMDDIAENLCTRFEIERGQALQDIEKFCENLAQKNILNVSEEPRI